MSDEKQMENVVASVKDGTLNLAIKLSVKGGAITKKDKQGNVIGITGNERVGSSLGNHKIGLPDGSFVMVGLNVYRPLAEDVKKAKQDAIAKAIAA